VPYVCGTFPTRLWSTTQETFGLGASLTESGGLAIRPIAPSGWR
jgi:hypothetical protein